MYRMIALGARRQVGGKRNRFCTRWARLMSRSWVTHAPPREVCAPR